MKYSIITLICFLAWLNSSASNPNEFCVLEGKFSDLSLVDENTSTVAGHGRFTINEVLYGDDDIGSIPALYFYMPSDRMEEPVIVTVRLVNDRYQVAHGNFQGTLARKVWYQTTLRELPSYETARQAYRDLWSIEQDKINALMALVRAGSILSSTQAVEDLQRSYPQVFDQLLNTSTKDLLNLPLGAQLALDHLADDLIKEGSLQSEHWITNGKRSALWLHWFSPDHQWSNYEFDLIVKQIDSATMKGMHADDMLMVIGEGYSRIGERDRKIIPARFLLFACSKWIDSLGENPEAEYPRQQVIKRMNQYYRLLPNALGALHGPWLGSLSDDEFKLLTSEIDETVVQRLNKDRLAAQEEKKRELSMNSAQEKPRKQPKPKNPFDQLQD